MSYIYRKIVFYLCHEIQQFTVSGKQRSKYVPNTKDIQIIFRRLKLSHFLHKITPIFESLECFFSIFVPSAHIGIFLVVVILHFVACHSSNNGISGMVYILVPAAYSLPFRNVSKSSNAANTWLNFLRSPDSCFSE